MGESGITIEALRFLKHMSSSEKFGCHEPEFGLDAMAAETAPKRLALLSRSLGVHKSAGARRVHLVGAF